MSQLKIRGNRGEEFKLNITQFSSPMSASINSVQTHTILQHFPIRCGQPDMQFTALFRGMKEKHDFQAFVRKHQTNARDDVEGEVTLWWPQRNIENWTGYIMEFKVEEKRFVYAPAVQFGVFLVNSLLSNRTKLFSKGSPFSNVIGPQQAYSPGGQGTTPDSMLAPPATAGAGNGPGALGGVSGTGNGTIA